MRALDVVAASSDLALILKDRSQPREWSGDVQACIERRLAELDAVGTFSLVREETGLYRDTGPDTAAVELAEGWTMTLQTVSTQNQPSPVPLDLADTLAVTAIARTVEPTA